MTGITGAKRGAIEAIDKAVSNLKRKSGLPVAVGFGIKTPEHAAAVARVADAAVVGSALVERIAKGLDGDGAAKPALVDDTLALVGELAAGVRAARR